MNFRGFYEAAAVVIVVISLLEYLNKDGMSELSFIALTKPNEFIPPSGCLRIIGALQSAANVLQGFVSPTVGKLQSLIVVTDLIVGSNFLGL